MDPDFMSFFMSSRVKPRMWGLWIFLFNPPSPDHLSPAATYGVGEKMFTWLTARRCASLSLIGFVLFFLFPCRCLAPCGCRLFQIIRDFTNAGGTSDEVNYRWEGGIKHLLHTKRFLYETKMFWFTLAALRDYFPTEILKSGPELRCGWGEGQEPSGAALWEGEAGVQQRCAPSRPYSHSALDSTLYRD